MRIYLRPIEITDTYLILKWRNTTKIKNHCFDKSEVTEQSHMEFYKENIETGKYKQFIVERIEEITGVASYPIATVYLKDIDHQNHRCELCIFTSDDEEWNTESQSIAIRMLIEKAFNEYGIHKIYSYVIANNFDEVELLEKSGFIQEAILKEESLLLNGNRSDVIRMALLEGK